MSIKKFIQEASLRGNKSTPDQYLNSIDSRAAQSLGTEAPPQLIRKMIQLGGTIKRLQNQIGPSGLAQLEKLAERTILDAYGSILGNTKLKISFPKDSEIPEMLQPVPAEPKNLKKLTDQGIIDEIMKRKISNNITQGEAKNSKKMLVMPEVRDGLRQIFGQAAGDEYLAAIKEITDVASSLDWKIPAQAQLEMWKNDRSGFAGSVKVDWEGPTADEDAAKKVLNDLANKDLENIDTDSVLGESTPVITAIGTDFAMLLHETIKGIYELIASAGIPDDEETAQTVLMNTDTLSDELEDLRYGPFLAADLRDFINSIPEADSVENMREYVFGKLMQLPAEEFLDLMKQIFAKEEGAKLQIRAMILDIKNELQDWEYGAAMNRYDDEAITVEEPEADQPAEEDDEIDFANMTKSELDAMINKALDSGDIELLNKLSKHIKE